MNTKSVISVYKLGQKLLQPYPQVIISEDSKVYDCLLNNPIVQGHMGCCKVDQLKNTLLKILKVKKLYLTYMDEVQHVHREHVPRYNEKGFGILSHKHSKLTDFLLTARITKHLILDI